MWWALTIPGEPGKKYCHKLGMGKPLGMGSVKLVPSLFISERCGKDGRYGRLFSGSDWLKAERAVDVSEYLEAFENHIMTMTGLAGLKSLAQSERLEMLLTMLEWRDATPEWIDATRYMILEAGDKKINEYKERPVLPDPNEVINTYQTIVSQSMMSQSGSDQRQQTPKEVKEKPDSNENATEFKTGRVKFWNADRAFGFIKPDSGGKEVFVHLSSLRGTTELFKDQPVRFQVQRGPKGPEAKKVQVID